MRLVVDEKGHAGLPVGLGCVMKSRSALTILLLHIDVGLLEQLGHYPGLTLESCQMLYATPNQGRASIKAMQMVHEPMASSETRTIPRSHPVLPRVRSSNTCRHYMDHMRIEYHVMKLEKGGERSNAFCTAVVGSELADTRTQSPRRVKQRM